MKYDVFLKDLEGFAPLFWERTGDSRVFAFHGEMGAGKTTMIEALCRFKGVRSNMGSPTFSIINEYVYMEAGRQRSIFHIDLYRLEGEREIEQAGVEDCIYSGEYCFVEWPQKAPHLFDENTVHVFIEAGGEDLRAVNIQPAGASFKEQS